MARSHPIASGQIGADVAEIEPRVAQALAWEGGTIPDAVFAGATPERLDLQAKARLWSLGMARAAGWSFRIRRGSGLLVERGPLRAWIQPVVVQGSESPSTGVRELHEALEPLFGRHRWALILRRGMGLGADVGRVIEPVRQWLQRVDQGKWDADYAIYEDHEISVELRLLPGESQGSNGATYLLVPAETESVLKRAEIALSESVRSVGDTLPVVPVLVSDRPWQLARQARLSRLYGTLIESRVPAQGSPILTFRRAEDTWFGSDLGARIPAVWWLAPDPDQPLTPRGWADENPWSGATAPHFNGERLSIVAVDDSESLGAPASLTQLRRTGWVRA